jgi:hypothetical protein
MKSIGSDSFQSTDTYCSVEYFHRMLVLERKRSSGSGKPFLVVLLDINKFAKANSREKKIVLRKVSSALGPSKRSVEIKGAYASGLMSGMICQWLIPGVGDVGQPPIERRDR